MNVSIYIWWVSIFKSVGIIFADSCLLLLGSSDGWFDVNIELHLFLLPLVLVPVFVFWFFDNLEWDLNF